LVGDAEVRRALYDLFRAQFEQHFQSGAEIGRTPAT
jgi:hypothetical protein